MNDMENARLYTLVQEFLDDKLDAADQVTFYSLLQDPAQREALTTIFMELTGQPEMDLAPDPSLQPILHKVQAVDLPTATPVRRIRYRSWAAAILLLLSAGGMYCLFKPSSRVTTTAMAQLTPPSQGQQGAVLTLADGSTVMLDSVKDGVVAAQAGANIVLRKGQVMYDPGKGGAADIAYNTISTPGGRQFQLTLPDGTKVWLNASSSLRYPVSFSGNAREVWLTGEVYFEVTKDEHKPFSVHFNKSCLIEVLGTAFNINAYADEPIMKTTLLQGSIRVNKQQLLQPGEQAKIDYQGAITVTNQISPEDVIAWKNGQFVMNSTDLPALFRQISRWYNIEVVTSGTLPQRTFGGSIATNVSLTDLVEALNMYGIKCKIEQRRLIVHD